MKPPRNLRELVAFLTEHPHVRSESPSEKIPDEELWFLWAAGGGMWWSPTPEDAHPADRRYLPIDCGMTNAETGVAFTETGFTVTKFNVPITYTYLP